MTTTTTTISERDAENLKLKTEMSIPALLKEKQRLDEYFEDSTNGDDDEANDRLDNVRDAIDKTIYEDNRIIATTKWGRPVLDHAGLERLVEGLSEDDKSLVRVFVLDRYNVLCNLFKWNVDHTLATKLPLNCEDVVAKLKRNGIRVVWQDEDGEVTRPKKAEGGHFTIINPTCTQCLWLHPVDDDPKGQVDCIQLIDDGRQKVSRPMAEYLTGENAADGPDIALIPLLLKLYGDELVVGEEALPLMSASGFFDWRSRRSSL